jgi:hypothetical protein
MCFAWLEEREAEEKQEKEEEKKKKMMFDLHFVPVLIAYDYE